VNMRDQALVPLPSGDVVPVVLKPHVSAADLFAALDALITARIKAALSKDKSNG
jgi:hypothetical protein